MTTRIDISPEDAQSIALKFLADDWQLSADDQDWLTVLSARLIGESWYVIEIGVEGLPDKWAMQVYDTGVCDPNYTFVSPVADADVSELEPFPPQLVAMLVAERNSLHPPKGS